MLGRIHQGSVFHFLSINFFNSCLSTRGFFEVDESISFETSILLLKDYTLNNFTIRCKQSLKLFGVGSLSESPDKQVREFLLSRTSRPLQFLDVLHYNQFLALHFLVIHLLNSRSCLFLVLELHVADAPGLAIAIGLDLARDDPSERLEEGRQACLIDCLRESLDEDVGLLDLPTPLVFVLPHDPDLAPEQVLVVQLGDGLLCLLVFGEGGVAEALVLPRQFVEHHLGLHRFGDVALDEVEQLHVHAVVGQVAEVHFVLELDWWVVALH